jgi:hypothetical protein
VFRENFWETIHLADEFMNSGAFFAASVWKRRKKPGYPLQFLSTIAGRLRDFRFYPLRSSVSRTGSFVGKSRSFMRVSGYQYPDWTKNTDNQPRRKKKK